MLSWLFIKLAGPAAFQVYGRGKHERTWRVIHVFASMRRNATSRWPFFGGACICWGSRVIAVGWDFADMIVREQMRNPASRERPVTVIGGRLHDLMRRKRAGSASFASDSEILAHECGHSAQARRFGPIYLFIGAIFTWWREGYHWWNWFENQASLIGEFGGIVSGTVHPRLWRNIHKDDAGHWSDI